MVGEGPPTDKPPPNLADPLLLKTEFITVALPVYRPLPRLLLGSEVVLLKNVVLSKRVVPATPNIPPPYNQAELPENVVSLTVRSVKLLA